MLRFSLFCGFVLLFTGCGGAPSDRPELAPVTGTITLDGQPLADARIQFSPIEGGPSSTAVSGADGAFELKYLRDIMGAKIGKHRITVYVGEEPTISDDGKVEGGRKEVVPPQYNAASTLEKDVSEGDNLIDLELTSE